MSQPLPEIRGIVPAGSATVPGVRLEAVEDALLRSGVGECVVLARQTQAGEPFAVAYVVARPQAPLSLDDVYGVMREVLPIGTRSHAAVELRSLPLAGTGEPDIESLLALDVPDDAVRREWERRVRSIDGVRDAAVVLEDARSDRPVLHLSDLLPGWNRGVPDDAAARIDDGADSAAAATERRPPAFADGGALEIPAHAPRTLTAGLLETAARRGARPIRFVQPDGSEVRLTYAQLLTAARRILTGLRAAGLTSGSVAILQLPDLDDHFPVFWACLLGGIKPLTVAVPPSYDPNNAVVRKLANAWRLLGCPPVIAAQRLVEPLLTLAGTGVLAQLTVLAIDDLRGSTSADEFHTPAAEDVAFFQLSSGSTGVSKCIQITHGGVVAHIHSSQQHLGLSPDDVTLNWLPMDHVVPLLMYHVKDVYLGIEQIQVPGPVVLGHPLKWLDYIERYRVTHTWSPNFGFKMLGDALAGARDRTWDLSSIKGFLNAGEQVTLPVVRDFLERVAPFGAAPRTMQPAFGMAEVCTCMTYEHQFDVASSVHRLAKNSLHSQLRPAVGDEAAVTFVDCGPPVRGVQIRIADRANAVLPEGTIGRLQIKGTVVTPGYLHNPEANAEAMVGDGWFNTGDLGFMWNGKLTITGREKELIIVNGANYYCYEIEDVVSEIPGVLATFIAACGIEDAASGTEALALFFVHDAGAAADVVDVVRTVRAQVAARVGLSPAYVVPVARDEFPKTTSGKIQRGQLKRWLLDGRFSGVLKDLDLRLENSNTVPDWFYRTTWRRKRLPINTTSGSGAHLLFADRNGLAARVQATITPGGVRAVTVEPGSSGFRKVSEERWEIDPLRAEHYEQLLREVIEAHGPISDVIHAWSYESPVDVDRALDRGAFSVLLLVQALVKVQDAAPVRLTVASRGAHYVIDGDPVVPERAAAAGLLKSIPSELSWIACRHVDLQGGDIADDAALLLGEHRALASDADVSYRDGERRVRRIERLALKGAPERSLPFHHGGLYLLTGGLGGVGGEVAKQLLTTHHARLLIIGRSRLQDASDEGTARAAVLRELQALPGSVRYEQIDVADASRLQEIVIDAERDWQQSLDGIIHLAGVFAERLVVDESPETFAATLRPKVLGTYALQSLTAGRPGMLFVTFSSAYGTFGGFAAAGYAAANAFLDAFVYVQRQPLSNVRAHCLAWGVWDDTGVSRGYRVAEAARARGFRMMTRRHGIVSFAAALHRDVPHTLIGIDEDGRTVKSLFDVDRLAARQLAAYYTGGSVSAAAVAARPVTDLFGRPTTCRFYSVASVPRRPDGGLDERALAAVRRGDVVARVAPRTALEELVARIWREALKQDGVGIHDNFFDLGGTSFLAGQIAGRLREALQTSVVSTQMFQFPTIASQAKFLSGEERHDLVSAGESRGAARRQAALRGRAARRPVDAV